MRPSRTGAFIGVRWTSLLCALAPCSSLADRGALSLEGGGGLTALNQPAPYASPSASTLGGAATIVLGGRYALTNSWEVALWGFYEPPVTYWHNGVTTVTADGAFPGTLSEEALERVDVDAETATVG